MSLGCFGPIDEKVLEQILQNKKNSMFFKGEKEKKRLHLIHESRFV